ncbi:hypothetical protein ACO0LL_12825 [Undibacterium sp. TC4M20W]|uniref:hypothetical protein n=1 Tax=unclassified Undibacterium TaxID=2630295 RepID=UPI003BF23FEF
MKIFLLLTLMLSALPCIEAQAQFSPEGRKARPRAECERVCNEVSPDFAVNRKGLDIIRAEIEKEKEPAKLKELRKKEEDELERVRIKAEKDCTKICSRNPE